MKKRITVVCENLVYQSGLVAEHGLAVLIESEKITLFDTGQGHAIINNLDVLEKDINSIDRIVLSHGHYDHTGGLAQVLEKRKEKISVYGHPDIFNKKIRVDKNGEKNEYVPIGMPCSRVEYEERGADFNTVREFFEIDTDIHCLSDVRRPSGWKGSDPRLKIMKNDSLLDDPFNDDLSLLLETESGPVVLLGCAHSGIVEILEELGERTGYKEFYAVIGGTHLHSASEEYIEKAIETLDKFRVRLIGTSHCTGFSVASLLKNRFRGRYQYAHTGSTFEF